MISISKIRAAISEGRQGTTKALTALSGARGGGSLILRVRPGAKGEPSCEWFADWRTGEKRHRMSLGRLDVVAVESADLRDLALAHLDKVASWFAELSKQLLAGLDPKTEQERLECEQAEAARQANERGSVHDLLTAYVQHLKDSGKKTWNTVERALITGQFAAAKLLGENRKAAEITPRDIQYLLRMTRERGESMAAHLRAYLHGAFAFGVGNEFSYTRSKPNVRFDLTSNPVVLIPRDAEAFKPGKRFLSSAELGRLWHELPGGCAPGTALAVHLLLAVGGQRVLEVLHAPSGEFDLEAATWTLPKERTKNGREHLVPLTERAKELVKKALEHTSGDYLFPHADDSTKPMPATSLNQAIRRFCAKAGLERFTPRDLRRTARTMLSEAGEDDHVLDRHFNHGLGSVGQKHYDRAQRIKEKRGVMARWDQILARAIGEIPPEAPGRKVVSNGG